MGRPASRRLTGAFGASPSDDNPLSLDHESTSGVLGRSPGSPPTGWDAGRARSFLFAVFVHRSAVEVGRGTNGLSTKLSIVTGSVPKHSPKVLPTPTAAPLKKEEAPDDPPRP
jgi:hypothetical protein